MTYHIKISGGMNCKETFASGQAFRWREDNGEYVGIVNGHTARVHMQDDEIVIDSDSDEAFWRKYFDSERDYEGLRALFCKDEHLAQCVQHAKGIRILHQPFFETLCTFIISQNNNIPRITGIVARMCETFGEPIGNGQYAFPTPKVLSVQTQDSMAPLRSGFRYKYIIDAAQKVASGLVSEAKLATLSTVDARALLTTIYGVGVKVADCTLLYGLGRVEVIPIDVHMRRAMDALFPSGLLQEIQPFAGIAQLYIFDYARRELSKNEQIK